MPISTTCSPCVPCLTDLLKREMRVTFQIYVLNHNVGKLQEKSHCEQDTSFLKLLGYGFQVKTLVGSTVQNHDMWRIAISISCCPRMQNGLGGRAGLHVHAQPLAGPLNSGGGMRLLSQTQVTFDFIGSSHSQLVLIVMGRRPQTHERWGSTAISGASARTLKNESWLTSELALKGNQKFPSVRLCTLWQFPP